MLDSVARSCTRCGSQLETGDRFCGQCGAPVPGVAADPDEPTLAAGPRSGQTEDFFSDWDDDLARGLPVVAADEPTLVPPPRPDQATTESIPTVKPSDTAVLPQVHALPEPAARLPPGPARVAPRTAPPRRGFPLGATIALLGAVAVVISALFPWSTGASPEFGPQLFPRDIEFTKLLLGTPGRPSGPDLGIVLLGAGLLGALVALITMVLPILKFLRRTVGLLTLAIPILFVFRSIQGSISLQAIAGGLSLEQLLDWLDVGVYVAAAGAVTEMVAGKWFRR
jgi:zinc ribbon protein